MMRGMALASTPTLRGRRLARELRELRERTDMSQAEAARRLGWDRNKVSRIEGPATRPTDDDVRAMLQLYGLDVARHDAILQLNKDSWQRGWWTAYGDAFVGNFVMLEDQAPQIMSYEKMLVPGLLQTPDYARVVLRHLRPVGDADLDRLVTARMNRKALWARAQPPQIHFVIHEAAFRSIVGDADLMRRQITEVWAAAVEQPTVTVQVLPFTASTPTALTSSFTLFSFPEDHGLDVAHCEGHLGEWYAESSAQVTRTRLAFEEVSQAALGVAESVAWLEALTRE